METPTEKTHVRYTVEYNGRHYEHPLHSNKKYFIKNAADVVNILEYCVGQDLKKDLYDSGEKLYNFNVVRLVNDRPDPNWEEGDDGLKYHESLKNLIMQFVLDSVKRNS